MSQARNMFSLLHWEITVVIEYIGIWQMYLDYHSHNQYKPHVQLEEPRWRHMNVKRLEAATTR